MSLFGNVGEQEIRKRTVWNRGHKVLGYDPAILRKDDFGYDIFYTEYGNRYSDFGWEIDHIVPIAEGGSDELYNLRPLNWRANARRGGLLSGRLA